jgi:AraC-like DNA-binding protein
LAASGSLTVVSVWPKTIVQDLREHGRPVEKILGEAGLDLRTVNREGGRIPWLGQARLLDIAARELADDCYGIHLAERVDVRDADVIAYLGLASRTLGDALANLARYGRVFTEAVRFEVVVADGAASLEFNPTSPTFALYRQQMEFSVGLVMKAYRDFTRQDITPLEVAFVHHRHKRARDISRFFGCRVGYGERRARIALKAKDLAIPIPTADHRLLNILRRLADTMLQESGHKGDGLVPKVERLVVDLLPTGMARAKVIAAKLGISDRTLSRRLAAEGTSFDEILDRLRHDLAQRYIVGSDLSLSEIAFNLGYANQPAFTTAFKRWSGKSPGELRH